MNNEVTEKQRRFCEEYMRDSNGTQAAIRAGYAPKAAQEQASRLLSNAMVQACLETLRQATMLTVVAGVQRRKEILSHIALNQDAHPRDRINAIGELNKMEGSHAPARVDISDQRDAFVELMERVRPKAD